MKLAEAKKDHYRRLAREQGYRSRAAFKLKEINKAYRIIGPGFTVIDLGCAPGGWTQIAAKAAGSRGRVIGADIAYVEEIPNAQILRLDIEDTGAHEALLEELGEVKADAVVCDLSPNVTGNWSVDHARQIALNYSAAAIMEKVLVRKGNAVFKVFDGQYSMEFRGYLAEKFAKIKLTKPAASRKASSELYMICMGYYG